jgi:hypothetical protein
MPDSGWGSAEAPPKSVPKCPWRLRIGTFRKPLLIIIAPKVFFIFSVTFLLCAVLLGRHFWQLKEVLLIPDVEEMHVFHRRF